MVRGSFLGSCYLGIRLPESRTFSADAPQPFSKNTSPSVITPQALRDKDVVESVPQDARSIPERAEQAASSRHQEDFSCVRISHSRSWRKGADVDVISFG